MESILRRSVTADGRLVALVAAVIAALASLVLAAPAAHGQAALTVDSTLDEPDAVLGDNQCVSTPSGKCTLRAAVQEIDAAGTVTLPAGLYVLTIAAGAEATGPLNPAVGDLDITQQVTIVGAGADRTVIDGNNDHRIVDIHAPNGDARISGVTLRNGHAELSQPTSHRHGGAIHNHGTLLLTESTVSNSVADAGTPWGGGGITNAGNGTATLRNVTITGNRTGYFGGGIENGGNLTIAYVTISQNTAPAAQGGGIASGVGFFAGSTKAANVDDTIVSANPGNDCQGPTVTSTGYNLGGPATSCPFLAPTDQPPADPLLIPINNTFGSVFVFGLGAGSPARDHASPLVCPATDERGVTRPQEGDGVSPAFCDIGAYEASAPAPTCDGQPATILGTAGNDTIEGTAGADVIVGLDGNDKIRGRGGDDRICGGAGKDKLKGEKGNDRLFGEAGKDRLSGGRGADYLDGGPDRDKCTGGPGTDIKVNCE
jgi:Ca2+-binding RTX toxin-like protein